MGRRTLRERVIMIRKKIITRLDRKESLIHTWAVAGDDLVQVQRRRRLQHFERR